MKKNEITFLVVSLILAAIVGGMVGSLIGEFLPDGASKTLFQKSLEFGVDPPLKVDIFLLKLTIGFMFKINFMSVLFIIMVVIYFRWWYI